MSADGQSRRLLNRLNSPLGKNNGCLSPASMHISGATFHWKSGTIEEANRSAFAIQLLYLDQSTHQFWWETGTTTTRKIESSNISALGSVVGFGSY